jgi:hypothetical protein
MNDMVNDNLVRWEKSYIGNHFRVQLRRAIVQYWGYTDNEAREQAIHERAAAYA